MQKIIVTGLLAVLMLISVGCQTAPMTDQDMAVAKPAMPAAPDGAGAADSATLAYDVALQPWCSNDNAFALMLMFTQGQDPYENFEQRRNALVLQELLPKNWSGQADKPVTKGTLAFMVCKAMDIKGGVMMHLIPCPRYAYRETLKMGLMEKGAEYEPVTGREAVGIFGRVARLQSEEM